LREISVEIVISKYSFSNNGKNSFAEVSKNLVRYRSENNFV